MNEIDFLRVPVVVAPIPVERAERHAATVVEPLYNSYQVDRAARGLAAPDDPVVHGLGEALVAPIFLAHPEKQLVLARGDLAAPEDEVQVRRDGEPIQHERVFGEERRRLQIEATSGRQKPDRLAGRAGVAGAGVALDADAARGGDAYVGLAVEVSGRVVLRHAAL